MKRFIKHFVREGPGIWACVTPAEWVGPPRVQVAPGTRFRRGETFMGVDVARLLDEQHDRDPQRR